MNKAALEMVKTGKLNKPMQQDAKIQYYVLQC
jgi:hypothetical protein